MRWRFVAECAPRVGPVRDGGRKNLKKQTHVTVNPSRMVNDEWMPTIGIGSPTVVTATEGRRL